MIPALEGSALTLGHLSLTEGSTLSLGDGEEDQLVYVVSGTGLLSVGGSAAEVRPASAGLVLAGEDGTLRASTQLHGFVATVGPGVDLHAPMGARELVVRLDVAEEQRATGSRSFQLLFGPHNGSTRATLFAGFIPPGRAPWHYHLYDEIVWVPDGPGRLHTRDETKDLGPGSAFRLRPRQVHIVENLGEDELTIIGVFTPAGSPSAAYLEPGIAAEYSVAG